MKIKNRIEEINKLRNDLDCEIRLLQNTCTHDEYHIGSYSWRVGCYDLKQMTLV